MFIELILPKTQRPQQFSDLARLLLSSGQKLNMHNRNTTETQREVPWAQGREASLEGRVWQGLAGSGGSSELGTLGRGADRQAEGAPAG